jgi:hypothetical protein
MDGRYLDYRRRHNRSCYGYRYDVRAVVAERLRAAINAAADCGLSVTLAHSAQTFHAWHQLALEECLSLAGTLAPGLAPFVPSERTLLALAWTPGRDQDGQGTHLVFAPSWLDWSDTLIGKLPDVLFLSAARVAVAKRATVLAVAALEGAHGASLALREECPGRTQWQQLRQ